MKTSLNINFEKNFTSIYDDEVLGTICVRYIGTTMKYLAVAPTESKSFKTLNGAEKFMAAHGLVEA